MISEELELRVKVERVSYSWCIFVVSHGYGGVGGGRNGGGGRFVCGSQSWGIRRMSGDAGSLPVCVVID